MGAATRPVLVPPPPLLLVALLVMASLLLHLAPTAATATDYKSYGAPFIPATSIHPYHTVDDLAALIAANPPLPLLQAPAALAGGARRRLMADTQGGNAGAPGSNANLLHRSNGLLPNGVPSGGTSKEAASSGTNYPHTATRLVWKSVGLSAADVALANNGNTTSSQVPNPPEPTICVGGGYVIQAVDSVLRLHRADTGVIGTGQLDLNTFYGYPTQAARNASGACYSDSDSGPITSLATCLFDPDTKRFYMVVNVQGAYAPPTVNIAVSRSSDPTKGWVFYKQPVRTDGQDGPKDPDETCTGGFGFCYIDRVRMGFDAYGIYITANRKNGFVLNGVRFYAMDKVALAAGRPVRVLQWYVPSKDSTESFIDVQPATVPASAAAPTLGRTYFAATYPTFSSSSTWDNLAVFAMSNTSSLTSNKERDWRSMRLSVMNVPVGYQYYYPRAFNFTAQQPASGPNPLGQHIFNMSVQPITPDEGQVASVVYARKKLYITFSSLFSDNGVLKVGPIVVKLTANDTGVSWDFIVGLVAPGENSLMYPTLAIQPSGRGVVSCLLVGQDYNPSAAYATCDDYGLGTMKIAYKGRGPYDDFDFYKSAQIYPEGDPGRDMRWGSYSASAVDEKGHLYFTHEAITQKCSVDTFAHDLRVVASDRFGLTMCGGTRSGTTNWGTVLSKVKVWRDLPSRK